MSDPGGQAPPRPNPMEVDTLDPPPPRRVRSIQRPVHYISEVLHDAKTRFLEVHKVLYVVLISSRKLCHYFQAHKISMVTSYSLRAVLHNPNATVNITKWPVKLAEFELEFIPRHAVKSQVLAHFFVDWTPPLCHPGSRMTVSQSPELWSSSGLTGLSTSMAPHVSSGAERGSYSLLQMGSSSSIWCTSTSRKPTTWQSMRPSFLV
jgi:hypothetical protein